MKKPMFIRVCAILGIGAGVVFGSNQVRAEGYNIVRAAIEAGAEVEYAGGKRAGYSYSETFPVAALFDGVSENTTPTNGWLGGILSSGYAEVKLSEAYVAGLAAVPEVKTYVVHRFNYGSEYTFDTKATAGSETDVNHAPTGWKLEGTVNGRDWVTIDEQTGLTWGETEYAKTFTLATSGKYIGFRFVPTNSWRFENRSNAVLPPEHPFDVGLMEIEYLAEGAPSASGVLFVTSDYPSENGYRVVTEAGEIAAPSCGYDGKKRFGAVTGYTLSTWTDGAWVDGGVVNETAYNFAADGTAKKLTWHFDEGNVTGYRLDAQVVAPGYESFTYSVAADAAGYYDVGTVVEVTPVEHAEPPYSYFYRWEGDGVTDENAKTKVLTVTMDGAKTVKCWFDRAWKRFDAATEVTPLGYFARRSNWGSALSIVVFDGCHAYLANVVYYSSSYEPTEGAYGGGATALSEGGRVNFTLPVWASDRYNTALFTQLRYPHSLSAAELVVGTNITKVGTFSWPNLVHVEGMADVTATTAPVFDGSPITNNVMELIPRTVTTVSAYSFRNTKVCGVADLPNVTWIGSQAFAGTFVTEVYATNALLNTIGDVTTSGSAFGGMDYLASLAICATNITRLGSDYRVPLVKELWFTSTYPTYFVDTSWGLMNWKSKSYNQTSFEKNHDLYIYASKKQEGWKDHVLKVADFTEDEVSLMTSDPKLGAACFGIVTNYNSGVLCKMAWAVHRASPFDKAGMCIRIQ